MSIRIRAIQEPDLPEAVAVWNRVVEDGMAFPQTEGLTLEAGRAFFAEQTFTGVALNEHDEVAGLYILHPNNIGRCGHIGNASYAVRADLRGQGVGEALVRHSLRQAKESGFGLMQFNAVVKSNTAALTLYGKLGFVRLGEIPRGFLRKDGIYDDIVLFYYDLNRLQ